MTFDLLPEPIRCDVSSDEIIVREHGICCRCGRHAATEAHHRQLRSRRGLDTWANQVGLCHDCHTAAPDAVHRNVELATFQGWIVASWEDPATVPLDYHGRGRVLLDYDSSINEVVT